MDGSTGIALAAVAVTLVGTVLTFRSAGRATNVNAESNAIKWVQEAKADAAEAKRESAAVKEELADARDEAADVRRELAATKRKTVELGDQVEEQTRWILRVMAYAEDESIDRAELGRLINGGPPSLRNRGRS